MSKRLMDVLLGGAVALLALPLIVVTAGLVRVGLGSPVLFRQVRPGLHGRPFMIYKFRTMREGGLASGALPDAQRLTRLGSSLRALSLDELPALWNVLRGDMSLVGPRPLLMDYLELYTPFQARRHEVKPGITGWAQVNGRNALTWEQKFHLDVWYVEHQSLWLDVRILARTLVKVMKREGISHSEHVTMERFRGSGA